jgi:hypothetical protein
MLVLHGCSRQDLCRNCFFTYPARIPGTVTVSLACADFGVEKELGRRGFRAVFVWHPSYESNGKIVLRCKIRMVHFIPVYLDDNKIISLFR